MDIEAASPSGRVESSYTKSTQAIRSNDNSLEGQKQRILSKRGAFSCLPVYYENDLVHGAWWYVYGSVVSCLIPIFPLISLYVGWWPNNSASNGENPMPVSDSVAGYALLTVAGIWYTVGSYIFINCFRNDYAEQKAKNVNILHSSNIFCRNDELIGIWCFLIGSLPFIPLMIIYVYYNPASSLFRLALALVVFGVVGLFVYILAVAPEREDTCLVRVLKVLDPCIQIIRKKNSEDVEIRILAPCVEPFFCCFKRHVCTDWLIGSWIITIGCFLGVVGAICAMIYYIDHYDPRSVYDYATGAFDLLLFFIGSMYITAGSYPVEKDKDET